MKLSKKIAMGALISSCLGSHFPAVAGNKAECAGSILNTRFESGIEWSMCLELDLEEGLTIKQLSYVSLGVERRILGKASLSQLETLFDDNRQTAQFMLTKHQLGGNKLRLLKPKDCLGGELYKDANQRTVVCARTQTDGLIYKYAYQAQRQGSFFEVFSISQATTDQTYTQRWRFYETGVIEPAMGFSGRIPPLVSTDSGFGRAINDTDKKALGFTSYLGWRLDFDLGKNANNDEIEEITSIPSASRRHKRLHIETLSHETARTLNPELKTTWRIKDGSELNAAGQAISYELVPSQYHQSASHEGRRLWLKNDIYFTRYHACEQFASDNPAIKNCPRNVVQYTQDQESIQPADLVVWYKQNYHYQPRSDDSDYISTDWVSFQLVPRGWTAHNPL